VLLPFSSLLFAETDKTCPPEKHQTVAAPAEEEDRQEVVLPTPLLILLLAVAEAVVQVVGASRVPLLAQQVSTVHSYECFAVILNGYFVLSSSFFFLLIG